MIEKVKKVIKNFIFPPFSELHLYCLLILLCLVALEYRAIIPQIPFMFWGVINHEKILENLATTFIYLFLILYFFWVIFKNIFSQKPPDFDDKKIMSTVFYLAFGIISLYATIEQIYTTYTPWDKIEEIFIYLILARSIIRLATFLAISDKRYHHIYILQMQDNQIRIFELLLLIIGSSVIYFLLRSSNPIATSIVLTYFYTTTALYYTKQIVAKFSIQLPQHLRS